MKRIGLAFLVLALTGCAKFPANGGDTTTHLVFRMKVAREINPNYLYYVALRVSTDSNPDSNGPIPVVAYPSKNGVVAGQPTHLVSFNPLLARPFALGQFQSRTPDASDPSPIDLARCPEIPSLFLNYSTFTDGMKELTFEITLDQLTNGDVTKAKLLKSVQVNFLTMNKASLSTSSGRQMDALGDSGDQGGLTQFITIPLTSSGTYNNTISTIHEPEGDVTREVGATADPDLDLVDWSIEVRTP